MKERRPGSSDRLVGTLSLVGRRASAGFGSLVQCLREGGGLLLPPVISGAAFCYFQSSSSSDPANDVQVSSRADLFLVVVLATYFLCDTACRTALGLFAKRLIAPLWRRTRERHPASSTNSARRIRSLRQCLCSSSRIEKNSRPCRSVYISHNPPPIPSLSTQSCN